MARPNKPWFRSSKNAWFATIDGRKVPLGVRGEDNKAEAERAWHRLMATDTQPVARQSGTIVETVEWFLASVKSYLKPTTVSLYHRHLDRLTSQVGTMKLPAITTAVLGRWLHGLAVGSTTKAVMLRSLSAFFGWCAAQHFIPANPAATLAKPKTRSRGADAVIAADTHTRLLSLAQASLRPVLVVLHNTGGRPGEVCRITAESLDEKAGVVRIEEHKTDSTGRPRLLFVSGEALDLLCRLAEKYPKGPLLRTARGTSWTPKAIAWALLKVCRKTGDKVTAYGYRHTFATDALAAGVPDAQVAELLGHSSTTMLHKHYSHLSARTRVLAAAARTVRSG